jgi:hypothetical protein
MMKYASAMLIVVVNNQSIKHPLLCEATFRNEIIAVEFGQSHSNISVNIVIRPLYSNLRMPF